MSMTHLDDIDTKEKPETSHVDNAHDANRQYMAEAIIAEQQERMGTWNALKIYRKAAFWSFSVSFLIIMEAYDLALIGNLMAQPAFAKHYGKSIPGEPDKYAVPAVWQSALNNASTIGAFIGILICGYVQPIFGYRKAILASLMGMIAFIFITFFAESLPVLFIGQLLCGLPWGFYNAIAQAYASEIAPLPLRGLFTMYNQSCWCSGQFITFGILYGFRNGTTKWAYKIPFAIQWAWPVPLIGILIFAPESPWWLVRKGRLAEAEAVVKRLEARGTERNPADVVAMMQRIIEIEMRETEGATYKACFQGVDLRRTIVACVVFGAQSLSGLLMGNQAVYFFTVAGLDADKSFALGLGVNAIQWVAVTVAFWAVTQYGRRTLYLSGIGFQGVMLVCIGVTSAASSSNTSFWVQATFLMLIAACYGLTIGPITFSMVAESSSVKLRAQTCALARATNYAVSVASGYVSAYALNPTAWNLKGKASFIWFGCAVVVFIFTFFLVPETKDRSYRELDVLYHRRVPARKFRTTLVDEMDDE